jgi:hypothetical protein
MLGLDQVVVWAWVLAPLCLAMVLVLVQDLDLVVVCVWVQAVVLAWVLRLGPAVVLVLV